MNILTFDIGVTNIRYALCDEQFRLSDVHTVPTRAQQGGQQIMERLLEIIGTYQHIDRVAVSTVGQVDSQNGIVVYSAGNIPYYTGMMIKKRIENDTGLPTHVENDVNAAALHGGEGGAVGVLRYAGAAAGVHGDGGVREGGAEEQRIGENADVRAEPHQLDLRRFAGSAPQGAAPHQRSRRCFSPRGCGAFRTAPPVSRCAGRDRGCP